jgi:Mn2+/Fe2+ NRAMP family transporter
LAITAHSYRLDPALVAEPPVGFLASLKHLGPSLILTANVVGSGELIMTTTLGAKAGFVTLWVVLVACFLKVVVQLEFGKHAINTGETAMEAFARLPGPRWRGTGWAVWAWLAVKSVQMVQYAGIVGGVALAMHLAIPAVPVWAWTCVAALATALLVYRGSYKLVESLAVTLTAAFTLFTMACVVALQGTQYAIGWSELSEGLSFRFPAAAVGVAVAVFGATGVSADEIISYPYWCLEKGYASFAGARSDSAEWARRARGWIRVMYLDAIVSMVIYTLATAAFYVLGAAILHGAGTIPAGMEMISTLSRIYTESFGPGAMVIFLTGSVVVLFSTLFVSCASASRMFSDALAQCGALDFRNAGQRDRWITAFAWLFPVFWAGLSLALGEPLLLILAGGVAVAVLLFAVVFAAYVFRYRRLDTRLRPGRFYDLMLWLSFAAVMGVAIKAVANVL